MSKLIAALLISVSLIASQTVFAKPGPKPGSKCHKEGSIKPCSEGTKNCTCTDTSKGDIKSIIKDNHPKASKFYNLKNKS